MPNPAVKPSIADGTAKGIRGRVGRRQNILQKGVFGKPKAPFFVKLPELHRREAATETCRGKRLRSDRRGGEIASFGRWRICEEITRGEFATKNLSRW
jgi:hypothetical protein